MERGKPSEAPRNPEFPYASELLADFLVEAFGVQAHLNIPAASNAARNWPRNILALKLHFGFGMPLEQISQRLQISSPQTKNKRSEASRMLRGVVKRLRNQSSDEIRFKYPWATLEAELAKNFYSETVGDHISRALGGKRAEIRQKIREGITDPSAIAQTLDLSEKSARQSLLALRKRGLAPELERVMRNRLIIEEARKATGDDEIRKVFAQVKHYLAWRNPDLFIPLANVIRQLGFRFAPREMASFIKVLGAANRPVLTYERVVKSGKYKGLGQNSYYVLPQQVSQMRRLLIPENSLAHFRKLKYVRQIAGPKVELPSTHLLLKKRGFRSFLRQVLAMGITRDELLAGSPVPIFQRGKSDYTVTDAGYMQLMEFCRGLKKAREM